MTATLTESAPPAAADAVTDIALVDLSSIAYPLWHMSGAQPDQDWTSQQIVARVRSLTVNHPKAAICCDKGRSFRHDLAPTYKANRPDKEAPLLHQIALAKEQLAADGYPVWAIDGFEADDLIATAVLIALQLADTTVLVLSADKDLLQLVGPRVRAMSVTNGSVYDEAAVVAKFGVTPAQMCDYLTLVGDASDNIKGATGIGPKKAAELLARYETLDGIYRALTEHGTQFKPAMATALREFEARAAETKRLCALRTDAPIPFADLDNDRAVRDMPPMEAEMETTVVEPKEAADQPAASAPSESRAPQPASGPSPQPLAPAGPQGSSQALTPEVLAPAPAEFERQLEPRSLDQAMRLANHMHTARMFSGYGSPQAVLSTILAGRELGLQAIASLRGFHVIEGKHALAADAQRGLVLRSGQAKFFRCVERTPTKATFQTHRHGEPEPVTLTYTIEEGWTAFRPELPEAERKKKWDASAWGKHPADMCAARASSKLARLVYADILFGLYSPEELRD